MIIAIASQMPEGHEALLSALAVRAEVSNPNGIKNKPEPGWSLWRTRDKAQEADFDSGFSNLELGAYLEFENACKMSFALPESEIKYWFRLSDRVSRIGTGKVEFGCWDGKRFLHTYISTAIKSSLEYVDCLQVKSAAGGVLIWSEPTGKSKLLRVIGNGETVKPGYFPATINNDGNRNWVAISSPVEGWVSDGSMKGEGNLRLCSR
ncbi:hypothetical protein [Calothrix sp. CCY 0018]|uniref:hypothetical protein n=1 Tax=Calothrix sp. CCY 0018 TaxID=3103864 RepID=UPI0039C6BC0F